VCSTVASSSGRCETKSLYIIWGMDGSGEWTGMLNATYDTRRKSQWTGPAMGEIIQCSLLKNSNPILMLRKRLAPAHLSSSLPWAGQTFMKPPRKSVPFCGVPDLWLPDYCVLDHRTVYHNGYQTGLLHMYVPGYGVQFLYVPSYCECTGLLCARLSYLQSHSLIAAVFWSVELFFLLRSADKQQGTFTRR
jgi:hypothetical protein